jgi:prepilin-type N-terminal cleavage/methylation domain-containing protein
VRRLPAHWVDDRGETLVEVLVAVVILGIAGVAVIAGLQMSVQASDIHRKQTTGGAYVRSYAEAVQQYVASGHYIPCAGADAYNVGAVTNRISDLPSSYTPRHTAARSVGTDGVAATGCTSATDTGVQQVTLRVTSNDNRADEKLTVVLRKPCAPGQAAC